MNKALRLGAFSWLMVLTWPAAAQGEGADIEAGGTTAGSVDLGGSAGGSASATGSGGSATGSSSAGSSAGSASSGSGDYSSSSYQGSSGGSYAGSSGRSSGVRIGIQGRLDAFNFVGDFRGRAADPTDFNGNYVNDIGGLMMPVVTPGARLVDGKLFVGLGLGFNNFTYENRNGAEWSRTNFALSPLASFDLLSDDTAALSLLGAFNLAFVGATEECDGGGCFTHNDDATGMGLSLGAGVRGLIGEGLALGTEFGWGLMGVDYDGGENDFIHGIFGTLLIEGTVGI
ncbi:MAG: hypothetical protein OEZ06_27685 [Myxococcales bacterium]|nr:hypothetical protein [Myxococcales bacterium]